MAPYFNLKDRSNGAFRTSPKLHRHLPLPNLPKKPPPNFLPHFPVLHEMHPEPMVRDFHYFNYSHEYVQFIENLE